MKHPRNILLGYLLLVGIQFIGAGCVAEAGGGGGVVYGPDVWMSDGVWINGGGRGWYGGHSGGYVHPGGGWHR